jgi:WD40 repeat protein/energy-coupling factor transporter ATP-binding protein EcfA2
MDVVDAGGRPLLFLSHAGVDTEAARRLKSRIEAAPDALGVGLRVWFDKDDLRAGEPWQTQLEKAIEQASAFVVYVGSKGVVNWVEAEVRLALSRAVGSTGRFPFVPVIAAMADGSAALPGFARQFQGVRDVEKDPGEFQKLLAAVLGQGAEAGTLNAEPDPFFGLRAINEERSHLFFGREDETEELVRRLRDQQLLLVVGDSGSGKSSMVKAGLVPRWRGGAIAELEGRRSDEELWHVIELHPGSNPVRALGDGVFKAAGALERSAEDRGTYVKWAMGDDVELRRHGLRCGLDPARTRTLVVVDQLEELVTLTPKEQHQPFVKRLLELADPSHEAFSVILTMRRDYYNLLSTPECRPLYDRLEARDRRARYSLGRMSNDGLRCIVTEPLRLAGIGRGASEALAKAVLEDVGERPGDLALVQFALTRTWERRNEFGGDLLRAYHEVGGVEGALAGEADRVFEQVLGGEANRAEVSATLIRLARLEGTAGPTRRVARTREFSDGRRELLQALADVRGNRLVLIRNRQLIGAAERGDGEETAEIAHEALLTRWPRLHAWLNEAPDDKRTLDRLTDRAVEWADAVTAEAKTRLLARTDAEREAFDTLARSRPLWLSAEEKAFVKASVADHEAAEAERTNLLRRLRRQAEIETELRKVAEQRAQEAELQRRTAVGRQLAAQSVLTHSQHPSLLERSALLAAESLRRTSSAEAYQMLWLAASVLLCPAREISVDIALSRDGRFVRVPKDVRSAGRDSIEDPYPSAGLRRMTALFDKEKSSLIEIGDDQIWIWDVGSARRAGNFKIARSISAVSLSPRLDHVATASATEIVVHTLMGNEVRRIPVEGRVGELTFSADGLAIAFSLFPSNRNGDSRVCLHSLMPHAKPLVILEGSPNTMVFSQNSRRVFAAELGVQRSPSGVMVSSWLQAKSALRREWTFSWDEMIFAWALSADASTLALGTRDGFGLLIDTSTGDLILRLENEEAVTAIALSPTGEQLLVGCADGTLRALDRTGRELGRAFVGKMISRVAFSESGGQIATLDEGGKASIWLAPSEAAVALSAGTTALADAVLFAAGGESLEVISAVDLAGKLKGAPTIAYETAVILPGPGAALTARQGAHSAVWRFPLEEESDFDVHAAFTDFQGALLWCREPPVEKERQEIARFVDHGRYSGKVALSPDSQWVATADASLFSGAGEASNKQLTASIWRAASGTRTARLKHDAEVTCVAFDPDGRLLATGDQSGAVRIWETQADLEPLPTVPSVVLSHRTAISQVLFSHDGHMLLTICNGELCYEASLWEIPAGRRKAVFEHQNRISAAHLSPCGKHLATASTSTRVYPHIDKSSLTRIWEVDTSNALATVFSKQPVFWLAFSSNGEMLAAKTDEEMIAWRWRPDHLADGICRHLTRNLTSDEWDEYLQGEVYRATCSGLP